MWKDRHDLYSNFSAGGWKPITSGSGVPEFLKTRGLAGWPDISVGGPGFCFPVQRWNGKAHIVVRYEYQGHRCRP